MIETQKWKARIEGKKFLNGKPVAAHLDGQIDFPPTIDRLTRAQGTLQTVGDFAEQAGFISIRKIEIELDE